MGLNVKILKIHHGQLVAELENYKIERTVFALTDPWLKKYATVHKIFGPKTYTHSSLL